MAELFFARSHDRVESGNLDPSSPYLQSPSYQLPLLWLALFDPDTLGSEEDSSYLVTEKAAGLTRLKERLPRLAAVASGLKPEWASAFVQLMEDVDFSHIHMDTSEFSSAADTPEAWNASLRDMLSSFESEEDMRDLVESAVPEDARDEYLSYCGSSGDEPAPWEQ